jgi:hypothetical protein
VSTSSAPIDRLRRLARALETGAPPEAADGVWLSQAIRQYEDGAATGLGLEHALGLVPAPGQERWWTVEARRDRDALIRQYRDEAFSNLSIAAAAREIVLAGRRYQASTWRLDKDGRTPGPNHQRLAQVLATGAPFPGVRRVQAILMQ